MVQQQGICSYVNLHVSTKWPQELLLGADETCTGLSVQMQSVRNASMSPEEQQWRGLPESHAEPRLSSQ